MFSLTLKRLGGGCTPTPRLGSSFPSVSRAKVQPNQPALPFGLVRHGGWRHRPSPVGSASRSTRDAHPCRVHSRWVVLHTPP